VPVLCYRRLYLDAIVTVVDAKHLTQHLDDEKPEGVENEVQLLVWFQHSGIRFTWRLALRICQSA
jgi:G3E family GTPase